MVLDSILPVLAELIKNPIENYIVIPIKRHISYAFKCDSIIEKLKEQTEQLASKSVRLHQAVDEAEGNGEYIYESVTNWLSIAQTEIQEAEQLIQSKEEVKKCCVGLCPNLKTRYRLSKKAAKKSVAIEEPLKEKEFDPISFRPPLQQIVDPLVDSREALPSRVMILNQVMDALKGPYLNMIGVYGMGGIGKTILAKEVYRKAVEEELFNFVVMVTVSQTPDLRRMQGEIADFLGLKFDAEEVPSRRASRLYQNLADSEVLIILDDIWAKLDLRSVGIPLGNELKRSKILLTSRSEDVLCFEMGTQKDFALEVLHEDEARSLFEMTMGEAKDPELRDIANEVVKRCAGLPILVIIVATYLKNRELSAWRDTLKKLFDFGNDELHEKVHKVVKSIYESLPSNEVKSIFLLCALFGGSNIPVNHLLTYAIGLDFFGNIIGLQDVRERLFQMIEKLRTESLLLDGDMNGYVKMPEVVLDFARSIATKEHHAFYGISGHGLREWPSRDCTRITLPYCDINEFPQGLEYPKAELFSLFSQDRYLGIHDLFFESFRKLKVLNLNGMRFMSLPTSLHFLTNLHSLHLDGCQLDDVAIIGELKQLEFLSFAESYIVELPKQIEQLNQLKLLDLTNCTQLKVFPVNVLSKLSLLEELYMGNSFVKWDVEGNVSVMELKELRYLTTLEIQVKVAKRIPNHLFFRGLQRYRIFIGDGWAWDRTYEASKTVKLRLNAAIRIRGELKELLKGTQALYLDNVIGFKEFLYDIDGKSSQQWKHLHIRNDDVIPHIINSTMWASCRVFPVLETLSLNNLESLEVIYYGQFENGSFSKLRILRINKCHALRDLFPPQLESIFSKMVIFPNLTSLIVKKCGSLKYIFKSSTVKSLLQLKRLLIECCYFVEEIILTEEHVNKIVFPNLSFFRLVDLPNLKRFSNGYPIEFPSLKKIEIKECRKLRNIVSDISNRGDNCDILSLFNDMVTFPNLQIMRISIMMNLEHIWHSQLTADSFCKLKSLSISRCWKLLAVFPSNVIKRFQRLEDLDISNCPKIQEIYQSGELNSNEVTTFELRHLHIHKMPSLKHIWSSKGGDGLFNFQNLKSVVAHDCGVMEYVFPASIACGLLQLEQLEIWFCGVKHIVGKGKNVEADDEAPYNFNFPKLTFLRLQNLRELRSFFQKTYFSEWPKLKYLKLAGCHEAMKLDVKVSSNLEVLMLDCENVIEFSIEHFSGLKVIELSNLKDGDSSFPLGFLRWFHSLEKLVITCGYLERIESILFDDDTTVAEVENVTTIIPLKYLKVEHCYRLKYIAPSSVSFQNLTTLHVAYCDELENLVTTSVAKTMVHLMELRITYCEMMKEIVADNGDDPKHEIIFYHLKCLELRYLPIFYSFCSGNYVFHFPLLEEVIVQDCLRMKIFCRGVLNTPKLRGIRHQNYQKEAQYWEGNLNATIASQCFRKEVLQDACKWYVIEDPSSSKAILANQLKFLNNLRKINVRDCDSIQVVFDLEEVSFELGHVGFLSKLEELQLINLPKLSELWNKDHVRMFDFKNLIRLRVQNCSNLRYIFTQSMASFLIELQKIEVENCKMMEAIIKEEKAEKTEFSKITLPSLKMISIKGCPSMKGFMSPILSREQIIGMQEIHEIIMPRLEEQRIDQMKDFMYPVLSMEQNPRSDEEGIREQIIGMPESHEIVMPKLEELRIDWNIIKHNFDHKNQPNFFNRLKVIELVFPSNSFPTMEELVLSDFLVEEIIIDGLDNHHELLPRLRKIILSKLSTLRHVVHDNDPRRVSVFQNLQVLQVWECSSLKTLVPSFVCFQNLTFLQVSKCDGLKNLITTSTAKSLVQLKTMYIGRCKMMQKIVVVASDGEEDEIGFLRLEYLVLDDLPCLTNFCSSKSTFNFPCLKELFVIKCPKMKMFARVINTPKLSQVQTGGKEHELEWEGSLNSTIQALSMEKNK